MGLTDKLKELKGKAEDAVVERGDQIHSAVEKATSVADERTGGKYRERIQKAGAKADGLVESLKDTNARGAGTQHPAAETDAHASADGGEQPPSA
jgi:DNA-binding protein H-NS